MADEAYSNSDFTIYSDGIEFEIRDGGDVVSGELTLEEVDEWLADLIDLAPENISWMDDDQILKAQNANPEWDMDLINEIVRRADVWDQTIKADWDESGDIDGPDVDAILSRAYEALDHQYGKVINLAGTDIDFDAAVQFMDDDVREDLHHRFAPCTDQGFFTAYEKAHWQKFGTKWEISKSNPTW